MRSRQRTETSKRLSWALRHEPGALGLTMDAAGWVEVDAVLAALELDARELEDVVHADVKRRLQREGSRIRACQGHSTARTPVTSEALEASWERVEVRLRIGSDRLSAGEPSLACFHGTSLAAWPSIREGGLSPVARTHVHLAPSQRSLVGKRAGVELLLECRIDALARRGLTTFRAPNGVLLVREVPRDLIVAVHPQTAIAARALASQ